MYPILHAMLGTLAFPLTKRRPVDFLLCMFFGLLPDVDIIFNLINNNFILSHRNLMHTVFPGAIAFGIITLILFKSFWLGCIPIVLHFLFDLLGPGKTAVIPGVIINGIRIPMDGLVFSSIIAMIVLVMWIIIFWRGHNEKCCYGN